MLSAASVCFGQQFNNQSNAAYWYDRAIAALDRAEAGMTQTDWNAYEQYVAGQLQVPPPNVQSYLNTLPTVFNYVHEASQRQISNYHLDYSQGFDLLLPHLSRLRGAARAMANDAEIRLRLGDSAGAARNLASLYSMSGHFGDDQTLISSLVGAAVYNLADGVVQQGFDLGAFNEADAAALLRLHQRLGETDPIRMTDAILLESEMVSVWLERMWEADDALEQFAGLMGMDADDPEMQLMAQQFDEEQFQDSLAKYDGLMGQVVEAFEMEDREAGALTLQRLEAELINGEHGVIAHLLMPSFTRLFELLRELEGKVSDRHDTLEKIVTGEEQIEELLNAATLYLQAIEEYRALDAAQRAALEMAGARFDAADAELLYTALDESAAIIEIIRSATQLRRCDFEALYRVVPRPLQLCPDYVHGLHALWRVLHLDAVRALRNRDGATAADRAALSLRMSAQMDERGPLLRPMVAHHWFNLALEVARQGMQLDLIDDAHRQQMAEAARTISRRDPFGYMAAIEFSQTRAQGFLIQLLALQPDTPRPAWLRPRPTWSPRQMMYFIAVHDLLNHTNGQKSTHDRHTTAAGSAAADAENGTNPKPTLHPAAIGPFAHLSDVIDTVLDGDALQQIIADMEQIGPQLALGELDDFIARQDMPLLAPFDTWRFQARMDLRNASRLLLLPDQADDSDADADDQNTDADDNVNAANNAQR